MGTTAGNTNLGKLFEVVGATSGGASPLFDNHNHKGAQIAVNVSAIGGITPIKVVIIEGYDAVSNTFYPLLTSANFTVPGFSVLTIYPGIDAVAGQSISQVLPSSWRIRYTLVGVGPSASATFGVCLLK